MDRSLSNLGIKYFVLPLVLVAADSIACSCPGISLQEAFRSADYVFSAKIIAAELEAQSESYFRQIKISFDPIENYKGDSSGIEFLYTPASSASCGLEITIGQTGIVFTSRSGRIGLCGGTWFGRPFRPEFGWPAVEAYSKQSHGGYNKSFKQPKADGTPDGAP